MRWPGSPWGIGPHVLPKKNENEKRRNCERNVQLFFYLFLLGTFKCWNVSRSIIKNIKKESWRSNCWIVKKKTNCSIWYMYDSFKRSKKNETRKRQKKEPFWSHWVFFLSNSVFLSFFYLFYWSFLLYLAFARSQEWDSVITCHEETLEAFTWSKSRNALGSHSFKSTYKHRTVISSVCISTCGNFAIIGSNAGWIDIYNIQSGESSLSPLCPPFSFVVSLVVLLFPLFLLPFLLFVLPFLSSYCSSFLFSSCTPLLLCLTQSSPLFLSLLVLSSWSLLSCPLLFVPIWPCD